MEGTACRRPGCGGAGDEDGYCDRCGHRIAPGMLSPATPAPAAPGAGTGRTSTGRTSTGRTTTGRTGTGRTGTGRTSHGVLGAGLADVPPVPPRDPATVVLSDPSVPESQRFCAACGRPVGRGRGSRPGRTKGFCPKDGTPFSFVPTLAAGDLVAGQYEVQGCLAHGGLGWIYLAADLNLGRRWVVLKGLIHTTDPDALAAAETEKAFLTAVDHPNIVKAHNFVQHQEPGTGARHGYLVMEYVGGVSLEDLLRQRMQEHGEPLPLEQAIPYALEALRALEYLHGHGMLYCDLKPPNLIQVEDRLKLIDLGAVRMVDDDHSDVWGTVGYQAPEVAVRGPSVSSDLYTVGRTLAVLALAFSPAARTTGGQVGEAPLPDPVAGEPESFHRFLRRATDPDPAARFATAAEMAEQLTGVLREVRAAGDGIPYPAPSARFGPERGAAATTLAPTGPRVLTELTAAEAVAALPVPLPDPADPAASALAGLAGAVGRRPEELLALVAALPATPEATLARVRVLVEIGAPEAAEVLAVAAAELPGDWRMEWYLAVHALATGRPEAAVAGFDGCLDKLPGECAPKLALAFGLELAGQPDRAAGWYATVWGTDHGHVSAAFGLARTGAAVTVLDQVPASSSHHPAAQLALVAAAVRDPGSPPTPDTLAAAGGRLAALAAVAEDTRAALAAELFEAALRTVAAAPAPDPIPSIMGADWTETGLRRELELVYRRWARATPHGQARRLLVDRANTVRPRTWW